jgi:hypothetical protein
MIKDMVDARIMTGSFDRMEVDRQIDLLVGVLLNGIDDALPPRKRAAAPHSARPGR